MDAPLMVPYSIALVTAIISPGASAQSNDLAQVSCVHLRFPDLLNISQCLGDVLKMCGKHRNYVALALDKLGECILDAIFSKRSLKIILTALRKPIIFAFRTLLPTVSKVVVPVLKALLPKPCNVRELQKGTCDRQLLPPNPCNGTINVTFNDPLDIRDVIFCDRMHISRDRTKFGHFKCIDIGKLWCFEEGADKDEMLIELMRDLVCVMKKLPALKVRLMLKKLLCRGMAWLIEFLRSRDLQTMRKVVEAFHTLGSCYKYYPTNPKAERRLLADADFYMNGTRRRLLH